MAHRWFQKSVETRGLFLCNMKVLFLLSVRFGSSFVESTTSSTVLNTEIQPTPALANGWSMGEAQSNISVIETSTTSAMLASVVDRTSSTPGQHPSLQVVNPISEELDEELGALVQELQGKITKETDPTNPDPTDINVIKTLTKIIDKGKAFLRKFNDSGNATVDIFNVTESLVVMVEKYDCLRDSKALLPNRSRDFIAEALEKFTDVVELTFQCPRIVKNDTRSVAATTRKRREVEIAVTVDLAKANPTEDEDFHEFQMLYHHTRYRRDAAAAQDCGQPACDVKRFETNLTVTNEAFGDSLKDESSSDYTRLTKQLRDTLHAKIGSQNTWFQDVNTFKYHRANATDVRATFYLDVKRSDISEETVNEALQDALVSGKIGHFEVNNKTISSLHRIVVDGNYSDWTPWGACDNSYRQNRKRECNKPPPQYGGRCNGPSKEKRQCACGNTMNKGGNITSPHFPGHYPNDIHCKWLLEAPVNNTVVLKLEEFHLEQDKKCFYDYVEFYEGNTTNANFRINQRLCGQKHPMEIKSDGRWLLVVFQTDKTENKPGFRFSWKASKIVSKPIEYVEQYVTTLAMIYSPVVNYTHLPLGSATTCPNISLDEECIFDERVFIISRLISTHLDRTLPLVAENKIVVNFEHIMNEKLFPEIYTGQKYCVTWNKQVQRLPSTGGWIRRGCSVVKSNLTHTSCACDHDGLFAVVGQEKVSIRKFGLLAKNTYIGLGISFFILILAITHIVWKIEVHGGEVMRINICAAILAMQCVFLIGAHVKAQKTLCSFLVFAIYFSVLAEFCWLLLHGLRIHGKIKKIFASNLNIELVYVVIGWGLPLLLALIAIGMKIHSKNMHDVCWKAVTGSAMWGYVVPVLIIALINVAVLLKLLIPTEDVRNHYDYEEMRFRVIKDAICLAFFGLTSTFAYQTFDKGRFIEQYLFSAFVVMQALAMFVFGREGRKDFVKREDQRRRETEETLNQDKSQSTESDPHIYESIREPKFETGLGDGQYNRARNRKTSNHPPDKIMAPTLKRLNIYKEGGHYVIEA